ncbi:MULTISPECIES: hypothetical protein [Bacillus]|uniref:hypothetical protein n=1 Tax=Bacillus TaxID=1386 RepID=UPI0015D5042E|nr:hypothetical protein [Bacillus wiedmannii]
MEKKQQTAEEIMEIIKNMESAERWKLLDKMYDEYFNKGNVPKSEEGEVLDY